MLAMSLLLFSLTACEKEGVNRFKGNYTFKISGSITVERDAADAEEDSEPITLSLTNESGQMDITVVDEDANRLAVSMNVTSGDMLVWYATAEGKLLQLEETQRHMTFSTTMLNGYHSEFGTAPVGADVTITGSGERYDNIIIMDLSYTGDFQANDRTYHITDSDIVCRAKLNE